MLALLPRCFGEWDREWWRCGEQAAICFLLWACPWVAHTENIICSVLEAENNKTNVGDCLTPRTQPLNGCLWQHPGGWGGLGSAFPSGHWSRWSERPILRGQCCHLQGWGWEVFLNPKCVGINNRKLAWAGSLLGGIGSQILTVAGESSLIERMYEAVFRPVVGECLIVFVAFLLSLGLILLPV